MDEVILVNALDEQVGIMEKMEAHKRGVLHRAFSVFIFNEKHEMLLQQRAASKYHSGGLWTNACCSHPRPGEATEDAAKRRLQEELGFEAPLKKVLDFQYHAAFENGLIEHEFDHVYVGTYEGKLTPNPTEVQNFCYKNLRDLQDDIQLNPHLYTAWFLIAIPKLIEWLNKKENLLLAGI